MFAICSLRNLRLHASNLEFLKLLTARLSLLSPGNRVSQEPVQSRAVIRAIIFEAAAAVLTVSQVEQACAIA
jgi:hypothetical protein